MDWPAKGEGLKLSWGCPGPFAYCERYELSYTDKSGAKMSVIDKNENSVVWLTPSTIMQLRAFYDQNDKKGNVPSQTVGIPRMVTTTLTLWPQRPNETQWIRSQQLGLDGSRRYLCGAGRAGVWFVVKDVGNKLLLVSPNSTLPEEEVWGVRENYSVMVAEDFDDLSHCPNTTEASWSLSTELEVGRTYALWQTLSFGGVSWNIDDQFAKAEVLAINGNAVTLKLAVSPFPGLRWVITQ